ncbi:MAG: hypothetical protein AAF824_07660 [Bacteroidota bacterium]
MNLRFLLLLILCCSLSSCLTIIESYTFRQDGSGSMEYTVDMSEMSSLLEMSGGFEENQDMMGKSTDDWITSLKNISGITKARADFEEDRYTLKISFDFSSPDALNMALADILQIKSAQKIFFWNGNIIRRKHQADSQMELLSQLQDDERSQMIMSMFKEMKYKCTYRFDKKVKVFYSSPSIGFEQRSKKEWGMETNLEELLENPAALNVGMVLR